MATSTVNSALHFQAIFARPAFVTRSFLSTPAASPAAFWLALALGLTALFVLLAPTKAAADANAELDVLRVDVPLQDARFKNGELQLGTLITNTTYIDIKDFNLRAVELEASSTDNGEVRLKVGRYVTPPVPLPGPDNQGLLRIEAPHKSNKSWRLQFEDRVSITSLTAVLEPRSDNSDYYASRYVDRGYTFGQDPNYQPFSNSLADNRAYDWLANRNGFSGRSAHWFWLNNPRSSSFFNQSYGAGHRHSAHCYDRFGRHLGFSSGFNRGFGGTTFNRGRIGSIGSINRPITRTPEAPQAVTPVAPATASTANALRNQAAQAAQAALQQHTQQAQARAQQIHAQQLREQQLREQQIRQQRLRQQQRLDAREQRTNRTLGTAQGRASNEQARSQRRHQRSSQPRVQPRAQQQRNSAQQHR